MPLHMWCDVKDGEIVLQYENGLLKQVLSYCRSLLHSGKAAVIQYDFVRADISKSGDH